MRQTIPYAMATGWKTLIDFTARDDPKVKDIKVEEVLDDSVIRELDKYGFITSLQLKPAGWVEAQRADTHRNLVTVRVLGIA